MKQKELQPKDLAEICGYNKSTLQRHLDDREMFPPKRVDENNNYRYYDGVTVEKLFFFRDLQKPPFRLKKNEIRPIFLSPDFNTILKQYNKSKGSLHSLHSLLIDKGYL